MTDQNQIWKFEVPLGNLGPFVLDLPLEAEIVDVQKQDDTHTLWAVVNTKNTAVIERKFTWIATGQPFSKDGLRHVKTFQEGPFVLHLFEVLSDDGGLLMTDALKELIAAVEAGDVMDWGHTQGYPRIALGDNWDLGLEAYLGSLDAAKALHDSMLPRWGWCVQDCWTPCAIVVKGDVLFELRNPIAARAWLLAILKAKLAMVDHVK